MTELPLRERAFDTFLSHAHADRQVVDRLHGWLLRAGLAVWYDATHLGAGVKLVTELGRAIGQCRSALVVMSAQSVASPWVEDEWNLASVQRNNPCSRGFRVIPLRIDDCEVPPFLAATKWVDMAGRMDDAQAWAEVLDAIAGDEPDVALQHSMDLYVSRSWQAGPEQLLADAVLAQLPAAAGLRLIGDSPDWPSFSGDRIRSIMRSCTGVVCVVPRRERSADNDRLKYFIHEARSARLLGLPLLLVTETGTALPPDLVPQVVATGEGLSGQPAQQECLHDALRDFLEQCRQRPRAGHVFLATPFDDDSRRRSRLLRRAIQRCTGLPCLVGEQVGGDTVQRTLIALIRDAVWVVADVSGNELNTCIEAGAARGAGVDCTLVAKKPYQQQPFMLRGMELKTYDDSVDLLAIVHRAARAYRRKLLPS